MKKIGLRIEDRYLMERRVAIIPSDIEELINTNNISFKIESLEKRVFQDAEYRKVGAEVVGRLTDTDIIFGVKEMPIDIFEEGKIYIFFSHTIKGQEYNMPLLKRMIEKKINLIEYEKITDADGKRLIFFGRFAGIAGMINSLWSLGQRLKNRNTNNPFIHIKQSHTYSSLDAAIEDVKKAAKDFKKNGICDELAPLTIGITGYGNVAKGAQEIIDLFETIVIEPENLINLKNTDYKNNCLYKTIFKEKHISKPIDENVEFNLQKYYASAKSFENNFEQYVPHITVLLNCMYWSPEYPRIITKDFLAKLSSKSTLKLEVVGDVTCDPNGSIESTHKGTHIEDPVFVYNPKTKEATMGFEGEGILTMAVDILPSELPKEASEAFSAALKPFIPNLVDTDFNVNFENLTLSAPLKRALILHNGNFTPDYKYMEEFVK